MNKRRPLIFFAVIAGLFVVINLVTKQVRLNSAAISYHQSPRVVAAGTFRTEDGNDLSLQAFKGNVVVLNFWETWCKPCREEMDDLNALQKKVKGRGIIVLPVSI